VTGCDALGATAGGVLHLVDRLGVTSIVGIAVIIVGVVVLNLGGGQS
jgi:multidrug transporter EmrE-like cation transporter